VTDASAVTTPLLTAFRAHDLRWLVAVPSNGLQAVYDAYEETGRCIFATREEEGVAIACGLRIGGQRPVVVMQQTGAGNAVNVVLSLADAYEIDFPVVVFDRTVADVNLVQRVSSRGTARALRALGCVDLDWTAPDAVPRFGDGVRAGRRWFLSPLPGSG